MPDLRQAMSLNFYRSIEKQSEIKFDVDAILQWLKKANKIKNDGLYVAKKNNVWVSPIVITKEKYETEKIYTETFIQYI